MFIKLKTFLLQMNKLLLLAIVLGLLLVLSEEVEAFWPRRRIWRRRRVWRRRRIWGRRRIWWRRRFYGDGIWLMF